MRRIALLLPTRNKPEELERILKELKDTASQVDLYVYVAEDDPKLEEYKAIDHKYMFFGEQLGFSRGVNFLAEQSYQNRKDRKYALFMRCEDDFYFIKKGWDKEYLKRVTPDGICMIWCNYVLKGPEAEPHTGAIGIKWYELLGFFSLPGLKHWYCDNVLQVLARAIKRDIYIAEPLIDHRHNPNDKRKEDGERQDVQVEQARFNQWLKEEAEEHAQILNKAKTYQTEEKREPVVMIGLPTMGTIHTMLATVIMSWVREARHKLEFYASINSVPVDKARNEIVEEFLKSNATHLFFIDSDTIPPRNAIDKLLAVDAPIVTGITAIVHNDDVKGPHRVWNVVDMDENRVVENSGIHDVKTAGGSCLMIRRDVFERMERPYFRFMYEDDNHKDEGTTTQVSEDVYFFIKALSARIEAKVDTSVVCRHHKAALW